VVTLIFILLEDELVTVTAIVPPPVSIGIAEVQLDNPAIYIKTSLCCAFVASAPIPA